MGFEYDTMYKETVIRGYLQSVEIDNKACVRT